MCDLVQERPQDAPLIDDLHAQAFGPGRYARTAYLLREGSEPVKGLSFVAWQEGELVGSIRFNPIVIGAARCPALLLGPLAVTPKRQRNGLGLSLIKAGLDVAAKQGHRLVLLIGDRPYYGKVGFDRVPDARLTLPGPYDPDRLLYLELDPGAFEGVYGKVEGLIGRYSEKT